MDMNKQQAQLQAAREVLYELIKESPYTFKYVAAQVGERNDTLSTRLRMPEKKGYGQLDLSLILNVLGVLDVPLEEFYRMTATRAEALQRFGK